MPVTTRRKSSGLISARAATADAQSPQRESFLFIFLCGEGPVITQVMKRFLSCGKLQQNRHQGIPKHTGVSPLTNPERLGGGALPRTTPGPFPSSSSRRGTAIAGPASLGQLSQDTSVLPLLGEWSPVMGHLVGNFIIRPKLWFYSWLLLSISYQVSSSLGLAKNFKIPPQTTSVWLRPFGCSAFSLPSDPWSTCPSAACSPARPPARPWAQRRAGHPGQWALLLQHLTLRSGEERHTVCVRHRVGAK